MPEGKFFERGRIGFNEQDFDISQLEGCVKLLAYNYKTKDFSIDIDFISPNVAIAYLKNNCATELARGDSVFIKGKDGKLFIRLSKNKRYLEIIAC